MTADAVTNVKLNGGPVPLNPAPSISLSGSEAGCPRTDGKTKSEIRSQGQEESLHGEQQLIINTQGNVVGFSTGSRWSTW